MASNSFSPSSSNSGSQIIENKQVTDTLPCILNGKYFKYSETDSTNTKRVAICLFCQPKEVKISGFSNSTSNFVTHLKRKHGDAVYKEYQSYLKTEKKIKRSSRTSTSSYCQSESIDIPTKHTISQNTFNENILNFFIHSMIPLQAIDDPFFQKMFDGFGLTEKELNIMSRRTLEQLVDDWYLKEIANIKTELRAVNEVCTTAYIWSAKTRSFLGVTVHWLDSDLKRKSKTLVCRRFSGTHNYDRIAILLEAVHTEFGLNSRKVLASVTDSGCSFVKAFNEFGIETENDDDDLEEGNTCSKDFPKLSFANGSKIDPLAFDEQHSISQSTILGLPPHLQCCADKLNLCATTDANKVLCNDETSIFNIHKQVIKKCNNIWNLTGRPKLAGIIQSVIGHTLSKPEVTSWNSFYNSLRQLASIKDKNIQFHASLGLSNDLLLRDNDFLYIKEYLYCSKPIAEALDILQGEQDMYYGILLPCLLSLRKKLQKLNKEPLQYSKELVEKYLESVEERFAELFDFSSKVAQNAAIASMAYPRFKDKWLICVGVEYHSKIRSIFKGAVVNEIHDVPESLQVIGNNKNEDSYFEFDTNSSEADSGDMHQIQRCNADTIITHYLADNDRDISMLNRYTEIKRVFTKYNTPLPSSGPVESFFPYATMTNLPKSHRLLDEMLEKRVLLKSNLSRI